MGLTLPFFVDLLEAVSLSALGLVVFSTLRPMLAHRPMVWRNALFGLLFGLIAILSILGGSSPWNGVILDGRIVMLTTAGLFGGPIAGVVACMFAAVGRIVIGDWSIAAVGAMGAVTAVSVIIGSLTRRNSGLVTFRWLLLAAACAAGIRGSVLLLWQRAEQPMMEVIELAALMAVTISIGVMLAGTLAIREERRVELESRLGQTMRHLYRMATTDELTALASRQHFLQRFNDEILRSSRYHEPVLLVVFDLDNFKRINDGNGHVVGDHVLREIARVCREVTRNVDVAGRIGGDEFAILMPNTELAAGQVVCERLRVAIEDLRINAANGATIAPTVSMGLAQVRPGEAASALLVRADDALYRAKRGGRNRVEIAQTPLVRRPIALAGAPLV
jgi:diguanylate cyclase